MNDSDTTTLDQELTRLRVLVEVFAARMTEKLEQAARDGRAGWDTPRAIGEMRRMVWNGLNRGDPQNVDVANLLALLFWHHDRLFRAEVEALMAVWEMEAQEQT